MRNQPKRKRDKGAAKESSPVPIQGEKDSKPQKDEAKEQLKKWTRDQKLQACLLATGIFYGLITATLWVTTRSLSE